MLFWGAFEWNDFKMKFFIHFVLIWTFFWRNLRGFSFRYSRIQNTCAPATIQYLSSKQVQEAAAAAAAAEGASTENRRKMQNEKIDEMLIHPPYLIPRFCNILVAIQHKSFTLNLTWFAATGFSWWIWFRVNRWSVKHWNIFTTEWHRALVSVVFSLKPQRTNCISRTQFRIFSQIVTFFPYTDETVFLCSFFIGRFIFQFFVHINYFRPCKWYILTHEIQSVMFKWVVIVWQSEPLTTIKKSESLEITSCSRQCS